MKSACRIIVFAVVASLLLAGSALAWDEAKLTAQIQGLLDQAAAGFMKKDVKAVLATSLPQATIKYRDGRTMTIAQFGEALGKDLPDWKDAKTTFKVEKVWPKGKDGAGALYSERHEFSRVSDPGHKHVIAARFKVMLSKTPQGWRFAEFTDLGVKLTRDGKALGTKSAPKPAPATKKNQG